jgi:hypothetical protein
MVAASLFLAGWPALKNTLPVGSSIVIVAGAQQGKTLPIAASRTVKLGGTVATVGFPDIGLPDFLTTKHTNYTKIKNRFILCPLSCVWCVSWLKSFL